MRLAKKQREALLQWVAEGLRTDEINSRANSFTPPFSVTRQQVDFYRKTREADLEQIKEAGEVDALNTGLSIKAVRVARLQKLAALLEGDLFGPSLWVTDVKAVNGEVVYLTKFNKPEVEEYRNVLDQIAEEVGDRKTDPLVPSEIRVTFQKPEAK